MTENTAEHVLAAICAAHQGPTGLWPHGLVAAVDAIDDPAVYAALAARLATEPEDVRARAARLLGDAGNPEVLETLEPLVRDPSGLVRLAAVLAVERHGPATDMVPALAALVQGDGDPQVRACAVRCLGLIASPDSDAALAKALTDPDADVRATAAATAVRFRRLGQR